MWSKALVSALALAVLAGALASPAAAMEDELDHGIFKYLYTKETRRMYYDPIPLKKIIDSPQRYQNSYVTLKCRFHRLEEDLAIPEFTLFNPANDLAFSVWDISAKLWNREEMTDDYPLFFVDRGSDFAQKLLRAKRFDVILIYGKVEAIFDGLPWFTVNEIKFLEKNQLNLTLFTHIELAEDMSRRGENDLAVEELQRALQYDLNSELEAMLYKRLGQNFMAIGKYEEAFAALEASWAAKKGDAEVYGLWGEAAMAQGKYREAIQFFNLSLRYLGKQADVYAKTGYCYAKVADGLINEVRAGVSVRKEKPREDVRRREKKIRGEYAPPDQGQFARKRRALTIGIRDEILALYDQAMRECRKALFIDPNMPDDQSHIQDVRSKKAQFLAWIEKEFGAESKPAEAGTK